MPGKVIAEASRMWQRRFGLPVGGGVPFTQVTHEHAQGPAIANNMMEREQHQMLRLTQADNLGADKRAVRQIETKPIMADLKARLMTVLAEMSAKSALAEVIRVC